MNGKGYQFADGNILWLSEADWWDMVNHAVSDEAWREANYDLLVAVGIMTCHIELVPSVQRFDLTKTYQICPPTWNRAKDRAEDARSADGPPSFSARSPAVLPVVRHTRGPCRRLTTNVPFGT